ncbi:lactate 2-monooxygenase [Salipaludibacillus aurantiacus]|uniref:L-lactate oxidase n=1 Tax=Salipaludibacillus aurantiacus TaxID=1601833 RepID=A0A1H9QBN5_9BACI|nr:lactate 2-monooxygenase [Salipaludibacillus aurantiacus]SER57931.1 L-lactate dehydrogenase (cytochrome) [Salipaludibacillus aurantiacus]
MGFGNDVQLKVYQHMEENIIPVSFEELELEAKKNLEEKAYYYVAASAGSPTDARRNTFAFEKYEIVPRMLRDTSERDLSVELFGSRIPFPLLCAPIGVQSIIHPEGELASIRAASEMGIPFISSTAATSPLEKTMEAAETDNHWFQLYWSKDREIAASMVKRAEAAGYKAIVVTLDTTMLGWREKDIENTYLPFLQGEGIGNYLHDPVFRSRLEKPPEEDMKEAIKLWAGIFGDPSLTWEDLEFLKSQTTLPIVLKGILHPDDAKQALQHGMDGIIVSNHGGRQVGSVVPAIDVLPEIAEAVDGKVPVLMDSGIRRGSDMVKALALGASAVLVGRPYMYGLALAGEDGVKQVLRNLLADFDLTMGLSGRSSIQELRSKALKRV